MHEKITNIALKNNLWNYKEFFQTWVLITIRFWSISCDTAIRIQSNIPQGLIFGYKGHTIGKFKKYRRTNFVPVR